MLFLLFQQKYIKDNGGTTFQKMLKYSLERLVTVQMAARYSLTGKSTGSKKFEHLRLAKCLKSKL